MQDEIGKMKMWRQVMPRRDVERPRSWSNWLPAGIALMLLWFSMDGVACEIKVKLWAAKHILVGAVTVSNDDEYLYVTYNTAGSSWVMSETQLYVGTEIPTKSSPGKFPYKHEDLGTVQEDTYQISLFELGVGPCQTVYLAAHAVVEKGSWVSVELSDGRFIWDIFKPGRYASMGPVVTIASNSSLEIVYEDMANAEREHGLIKDSLGTAPDEVKFWLTCVRGTPRHSWGGDPHLLPGPTVISRDPRDLSSHWIPFPYLDQHCMPIKYTPGLEEGMSFTCYTMVETEICDSEGFYPEDFTLTVYSEETGESETAWAEGTQINGGWAMYFDYHIQ